MKKFLKNTQSVKTAVSDIDTSGGFIMSVFFDTAALERSIAENGVINPLIIDNRNRLLSGLRRIAVCKALNMNHVPCVTAEGDEKEIFRAVLLENLSHRRFNHLEAALVIKKLGNWLDDKTIVSEYMPLLGYSSSLKLMKALSAVLSFDKKVQQALAEEELLLSDITLLGKFEEKDRDPLVSILLSINAGLNARKEILENLFEISRRDDLSISEILEKVQAENIINNEQLSQPEKTAALRKAVKLERYPLLSSLEDKLRENVSNLKLPHGTSVQPPAFFEGSDYKLTVSFKDESELGEKLEKIKDIGNAKILPDPHID